MKTETLRKIFLGITFLALTAWCCLIDKDIHDIRLVICGAWIAFYCTVNYIPKHTWERWRRK